MVYYIIHYRVYTILYMEYWKYNGTEIIQIIQFYFLGWVSSNYFDYFNYFNYFKYFVLFIILIISIVGFNFLHCSYLDFFAYLLVISTCGNVHCFRAVCLKTWLLSSCMMSVWKLSCGCRYIVSGNNNIVCRLRANCQAAGWRARYASGGSGGLHRKRTGPRCKLGDGLVFESISISACRGEEEGGCSVLFCSAQCVRFFRCGMLCLSRSSEWATAAVVAVGKRVICGKAFLGSAYTCGNPANSRGR